MSRVARSARVGSRQRPEVVTGTKAIIDAESGETYIIAVASGTATITLPESPEDGAYFTFIAGKDFGTTATTLVRSAGTTPMNGQITHCSNSFGGNAKVVVPGNASDNTFALGSGSFTGPGSRVECVYSSTDDRWYVDGHVSGGVNFQITA